MTKAKPLYQPEKEICWSGPPTANDSDTANSLLQKMLQSPSSWIKQAGEVSTLALDIVPPAEHVNPVTVTPEQRAENTRRMAMEDSIRNAYTATFYKCRTS